MPQSNRIWSNIFFLGLGTLLGSLTTGLVIFLFIFIALTIYHKFVEKEELLLRFGTNYERYKKKPPFFIPRIKLKK